LCLTSWFTVSTLWFASSFDCSVCSWFPVSSAATWWFWISPAPVRGTGHACILPHTFSILRGMLSGKMLQLVGCRHEQLRPGGVDCSACSIFRIHPPVSVSQSLLHCSEDAHMPWQFHCMDEHSKLWWLWRQWWRQIKSARVQSRQSKKFDLF